MSNNEGTNCPGLNNKGVNCQIHVPSFPPKYAKCLSIENHSVTETQFSVNFLYSSMPIFYSEKKKTGKKEK